MERERKGKQGKKEKKRLCGLNQNPDFSDPIAKLLTGGTDVELLRQVCVSVRAETRPSVFDEHSAFIMKNEAWGFRGG